MAWAVAAVAAIGTGLTVNEARKSRESSEDANDRALDAQDKALAFEQERYDDWKATYGNLESSLANFYGSLSPSYFSAQGMDAFNRQLESTQKRLQEAFVQRGIDPDSGLGLELQTNLDINAAEARASIEAQAPLQAAESQRSFLATGLGQNPAGSVSNVLGNISNNAYNYARDSEAAAAAATGQAYQTAIEGVSDVFGAFKDRPKNPS